VAAAQSAGVRQFDYIVATHYDADHAGNIPRLDSRIPGRIFVDHGAILATARETSREKFYQPYLDAIGNRKRMSVKPGDMIPMKGLRITVVTAGGEALIKPLRKAGKPDALCASIQPEKVDNDDNAGSVGMLFEFGRFRMLDLADLLQAVEYKLMCPRNLVGTVDLFMVSHHGFRRSNSQLLIHAIQPRVAVMNNGPRKGGDPQVFDILRTSPGFQDLWQLHLSPAAGDKNSPEDFIANLIEQCEAKLIKVSARRDGSFTVTNTRNNYSKIYRP
jgi:competence protein ComEC